LTTSLPDIPIVGEPIRSYTCQVDMTDVCEEVLKDAYIIRIFFNNKEAKHDGGIWVSLRISSGYNERDNTSTLTNQKNLLLFFCNFFKVSLSNFYKNRESPRWVKEYVSSTCSSKQPSIHF
jgi:hypothetical protein